MRSTARDQALAAEPYQQLRDRVLRQAMTDAVRQAVGAIVRSRTTVSTEQVNDTISDRLYELITDKAQGRIESYRLLTEEIDDFEGGERWLSMTIEATVCVPDPSTIPEIVAIGDVLSADRRTPIPELRQALLSAFPESDRLLLADGSPAQVFHDLKVRGAVVRTGSTLIDNSESRRLLSKFVRPGMVELVPELVQRVTVEVAVEVVDPFEQSLISQSAERSHTIAPEADPEPYMPELLRDAAQAAARLAYDRLIAARR